MSTFPAPPPPPPPPAPGAAKSSGCWKWGACGCFVAVLIVIIGLAGIAAVVFGVIKSTDAYRGAIQTAEHDPRVVEALGSPMHAGIWVVGTVHVDNGEGEADIRFPLIGPKNRASVHAVATRSGPTWHYSELTVTPRDGNPIDVLSP